jgi:hypothetical protein
MVGDSSNSFSNSKLVEFVEDVAAVQLLEVDVATRFLLLMSIHKLETFSRTQLTLS